MIRSGRPARALRHLNRYYYQTDAELRGRTVLQPVPARSPQAIEITFGTPYTVHRLDRGTAEQAHSIALIGAQTFRRVDLVMQGNVDAFTIVFQPGGLFMLFAMPGEVLTNDHFEGESALGRRVGAFARRLGAGRRFGERIRIANEYFCTTRSASDAIAGMPEAAVEILSRSGCVRVSDLARSAGIGIRQFERRFRYEIGISPKLYARIARFETTLRRKPEMAWTDIAHALGYYDQMHMVHDFNQLSGDSPSAIGSQLDMFVQPEMLSRRFEDRVRSD